VKSTRSAPNPEHTAGRAMEFLLGRTLDAERTMLTMVEALAAPPTIAELLDFYRRSGFLYPGKAAELEQRWHVITRTWERLLGAGGEVFRLVARRRLAEGRLSVSNSICAFQYAPGTWQGQHLVSEQRHEYVGTLTVLIGLVQWFHDAGVRFARLSFRPNNPGTNRLFGDVAEMLPPDVASVSVADYGMTSISTLAGLRASARDAAVEVHHADRVEALRFYAEVLPAVELASLGLDDLEFDKLDGVYARHGLSRRRQVYVATVGDRVVGGCMAHHSSEGINFSFLENAIEHLRVAPDLPPRDRSRVWTALLRAAVREADRRRGYVVTMTDPGDRELAAANGLLAAKPKQYAVLTVSRERDAFLRSIEQFVSYYRALLRLMAETEPAHA
jgi:hypothetical protein